jgi:leader peptidase (prepilin peptidase)/N-methyltransferase
MLGIIFCFYAWMLIDAGCQTVSEVRPATPLLYSRLPFQLLFISLLATAVLTDLIDYVIPDPIPCTGIALAMGLATFSGELQMIHLWVDWNDDLVSLYGPFLPQWIKDHQHLHGLAWSLSGGVMGSGLMWLARILAHRILGFPAIGFGDVTLMAMIGSFMGWQPVLCVLAVAPIIGMLIGLTAFVVTGRSFVAFGPYLCAAAFAILCTWREIWEVQGLRIIFGHWPSLAAILTGTFSLYCLLLWGVRILRETPTQQLR